VGAAVPAAACYTTREAAPRRPDAVNVLYAPTLIALDTDQYGQIARTVSLLFEVAHGAAWARKVDAGASEVALHQPGNAGVFMGYDFHLGPDGPRLIEINTNAGGALLNGLHTAARCDPEALGCLCLDLCSVDQMEERLVETFRAELAAARAPEAELRRVAIADERPREQFLHPEFELFRQLFERHGIAAVIVDTAELKRAAGGGIEAAGGPVDLVYLRDTDFLLETPRCAALREAYLADEVVVTPAPREHHLLANKARMVTFSDRDALRALGVAKADAEFLARVVPETRRLEELGLERAWSERREWVFKPASGFASRGVYRGDKLTRRKLEEIAAAGGYLAQRRIEPGAVSVATSEGSASMKFDVRAYAYRGQILLLGARVYQGQVTNLRTPGGGFSAICVARTPGA
jgi:hypothetical protein